MDSGSKATGKKLSEVKETRSKKIHLSTFNEIGKALTSSLDLKEILNIVMEKISEILKPNNWSLLLMDEEKGDMRFEIVVGEGSDKLRGMRLKVGEGVAGWVAKEKKPLLVPDVSKDERFCKRMDEATTFKTNSVIAVPLITRGKCLGVVELINKVEDGGFEEEDLLLLKTLADYTAIAIENAIFFRKVEELTITDDLTKLYNSRFLHNRLDYEVERAKRFKYELSMIFLDLDYFKEVNDRFGHLCGSKLLREVAQLIVGMIRNIDMACRYGGDEFIIVMPDTAKKNAVLVAEKLRKGVSDWKFLQDEGINLHLTASFGVASYPKDADNKNDLIHMADNAMYKVKNKSRNGVAEA